MIGKVVGTYKIIAKIGEGGMGSVYKGIDEMLEREVAIKVLRPELASQPNVVERFRTEAKTLAKLNHTYIATVYNFLHQDDHYFMVMEFVRGETLDNMIRRSGPIPYEQAVAMFCQALEGLEHAHSLGIIHRDIKPANIMLTDTGIVKVMDFGIARVLGTSRMTKQGNIIGTIEYMSPEQVRGDETDARSDIYSAGILFYEMLTGRVPFESKSEFELMKSQIEDPPPPPRNFAYVPEQAEEAIMRALAKKPDARFQSAAEFRQELFESMKGGTVPLGDSAPVYAAPATRVSAPAGPVSADAASKETKHDEDIYVDKETIITTPRKAAADDKPAEPIQPAATEPAAADGAKERVRQVIPLEADKVEKAATPRPGKFTWKHYAAAAAVLIALVIGTVALVNKDNGESTQPQTPSSTPAAVDQNAAQPATQPQANTPPPEQAQSNTSSKEPKRASSKKGAKKQEDKGVVEKTVDWILRRKDKKKKSN
jgi:serine/threonine-protein kinase